MNTKANMMTKVTQSQNGKGGDFCTSKNFESRTRESKTVIPVLKKTASYSFVWIGT